MLLDPYILEGEAVAAYERARLDPAVPVSSARIVRELFGPRVITRDAHLLGGRLAATAWLYDEPRIAVRRGLPIELEQHAIGHELAHLLLGSKHSTDPTLEAACDYLGAALIAPRPAVFVLHRALGLDWSAIADELVVTQTCAALRAGEVLGMPLALIGPRIRVRGPEEHVWPEESVLRAWARRPPRGVTRQRLTDQRGRAVLLTDD